MTVDNSHLIVNCRSVATAQIIVVWLAVAVLQLQSSTYLALDLRNHTAGLYLDNVEAGRPPQCVFPRQLFI